MRSNAEFRNLAWKRLWADHWFGRLFGGGLLLGLCGYAVQVVLSGILGRLGVQSWIEYLQAVAQNRQDLTTPIPNLTSDYISQASSSTLLTFFFSFLMAGIASYGGAVILRKCLANDEKDWLGEAFGGFKFPFGMLWLQVRYWLICFGWGFIALFVPGVLCGAGYPFAKGLPLMQLSIVVGFFVIAALCWMIWIYCIPFYRYRFLWLVKAEHPEWGAGECICACRKLMKGNMLKSFRLDCSYWKPITLVLLLVLLVMAIILSVAPFKSNVPIVALLVSATVFAFLACVVGAVVLGQYISVGQGFLYEDLKDGQTTEQNERNA